MLLYGIERDDLTYILSTFGEPAERDEVLLPSGSQSARVLEHYDRLRG